MGICSDVYISREEAEKMVLKGLLYDQKVLLEKVVKVMEDHELTSHLNKDSDLYYYNIEKKKKKSRPLTKEEKANFKQLVEEELVCDDCGTSEDVEGTYCPYSEDVNNTKIEVKLCGDCYGERCQDI